YAVGVDSGTSALELALRAYDIGPGDEVITAANSFIASALAISHAGATPVLVDVDPFTHTIDVTGIERAITSRTKAIIPVHLYGHPAHMDPIRKIAEQQGLIVIEDACKAHGARYKGRRAGSVGHAARRWQAELYHRLLAGTALVLPSEAVGAQSVWHLYVIRTEYRDKLKEYLASRGIAAGIHYPVPIHLQPAYKNLGYKRGSFPVTEQYAQRILSLPMYAELTPELIEYVSKSILTFLSANHDSHAFYEQLVRHATPSSL